MHCLKFKILHCLNNATAIILQMHMIQNVVIRNYLGKPQHLPRQTLKLLLDKNGTQQHITTPPVSIVQAIWSLFITSSTFMVNPPTPDLARDHLEQYLTVSCLHCWTYQYIKTHYYITSAASQDTEN